MSKTSCRDCGKAQNRAFWRSGLWLRAQVGYAHVDIAGPAWDNKASIATGMGATTLAEWACAQGAAPRNSE